MMDPGDISWLILPDSVALSGMIIFIASTSTKGSPDATSAPSSWRNRTTLPVMSDLSSLGTVLHGRGGGNDSRVVVGLGPGLSGL